MLLKGKSQAVYVTQRAAITIRTAYHRERCKKIYDLPYEVQYKDMHFRGTVFTVCYYWLICICTWVIAAEVTNFLDQPFGQNCLGLTLQGQACLEHLGQ